ncbi:hypothetical protein VOLCADRAFT_105641 [Volvox carteri f. nagariensis]|uniref:ABC1 atypical kinase-like domain-containing protein n=1 Tax=Volvox carteri f. nagariensis TaxID=3068 RepID=D8U214_VOLCA|nr:uncharacterized protein VOLCADRAFT_105641 [Volvox carteri f. nagariensis]EFJ46283.1 hypothetical protein VOLCADRAFT_105641 [Volvox carteri f. nagariensis]|eukprot:XP_002952730.1 hypothetical protein VOLCADRAFT_105641 [Volvox carteri f. nagariensis]
MASATTTRTRGIPVPGMSTRLEDIRELKDLGVESSELRDLQLRDVRSVSYVSRRRLDAADFDPDEVDADGLPLVYNEERIAGYWGGRPGELAGRWTKFAAVSAPWLTKLANAVLSGRLERDRAALAREAVDNLEKLGPTFIKLGQILSIRCGPPLPAYIKQICRTPIAISEYDSVLMPHVYRARLRSTGEEVADLYVMRRAVGVYEKLVKRFTAQTTDYQRLLSTFAEGLYTEMDFRNEALNAARMAEVGQEAFLTQLLEIGFFHGDPHPGNLLKGMVAATIHLDNRDWSALVDDFVELGFLPPNPDRALIIPVMDRVLSPYLRGGGAAAFNFSALSQDLLAATLEIPFSVPPYMSLLARSVATLEGIALAGDPQYAMVAQAYPFVARKVLRNDSSTASALLRDLLLIREVATPGAEVGSQLAARRLAALLNAALGYVADSSQGFVDFDALPAEGASVQVVLTPSADWHVMSLAELASFLLSAEARELRPLLTGWVVGGLDLLLRDRLRKAFNLATATLTPRLPFLGSLPAPPPPPLYVPGRGLVAVSQVVDLLAPPLEPGEQVYLQQLTELAAGVLGVESATLESPTLQSVLQLASSPPDQPVRSRILQTVAAAATQLPLQAPAPAPPPPPPVAAAAVADAATSTEPLATSSSPAPAPAPAVAAVPFPSDPETIVVTVESR